MIALENMIITGVLVILIGICLAMLQMVRREQSHLRAALKALQSIQVIIENHEHDIHKIADAINAQANALSAVEEASAKLEARSR